MLETLYSFGYQIFSYFSQIVNTLSTVEIFGYTALDIIFGAGLGAYFVYVSLQWVIPE